jgi:glutamate racemase
MTNLKNAPIAVFDSGVGGISVLRHLRRLMPGEHYLYFGDSANAPYGSRTTEDVRQLTLSAAAKLTARGIKALVIACNTATAAAVQDVRKQYPNLIVIGIEPALKLAADHYPGGRIGVMATEVTLREEKFDTLLHRFNANCTVAKIPAPGLVQLIEAGMADHPEAEALLQKKYGKAGEP